MARVKRTVRWLAAVTLVLLATVVPGKAGSLSVPAADAAVIENPECVAERHTLLRFELPDELAGATIELAIVEFRASVTSSDTTGALVLDAFAVTTEWSGGTVGWADGWSTPGGDFDRFLHGVWTAPSGQSSIVRFDVTSMVRAWASGSCANRGVIVRAGSGMIGGVEPAGMAGGEGSPLLLVYYTRAERYGPR
jgi:hypothetical protein